MCLLSKFAAVVFLHKWLISCGSSLNKSITLPKNTNVCPCFIACLRASSSHDIPHMKSFLALGYFTANRPVQAVSLASPLGYVHIVPNEFPAGWKFARLGVLLIVIGWNLNPKLFKKLTFWASVSSVNTISVYVFVLQWRGFTDVRDTVFDLLK